MGNREFQIQHFDIITDHASLVWLTNFKNPEGMVARWLQHLSPYAYTIHHKAGRLHNNADGLSRQRCRPCKRPGCSDCKLISLDGQPIALLPDSIEKEDDDVGLKCIFESNKLVNRVTAVT